MGATSEALPPWKTLGRARAIENQVAFGCNCTGRQAGRPYVGASVAYDAWGDCLGELDEHPGVLRCRARSIANGSSSWRARHRLETPANVAEREPPGRRRRACSGRLGAVRPSDRRAPALSTLRLSAPAPSPPARLQVVRSESDRCAGGDDGIGVRECVVRLGVGADARRCRASGWSRVFGVAFGDEARVRAHEATPLARTLDEVVSDRGWLTSRRRRSSLTSVAIVTRAPAH